MYYTYILQSESNGRFYIGSTQDLDARLNQHNDPLNSKQKTTSKIKGPWILVYSEIFDTRSEALSREKYFKSWKSSKAIERFINANQSGRVPTGRD